MAKLHILDLPTFAHHCRVLATEPGGSTGSLSCLPGLVVHYRIVKCTGVSGLPKKEWDSVYLGYSVDDIKDHCGNRYGGVRAYARIVQDHLHNLNVDYHNEIAESKKN